MVLGPPPSLDTAGGMPVRPPSLDTAGEVPGPPPSLDMAGGVPGPPKNVDRIASLWYLWFSRYRVISIS